MFTGRQPLVNLNGQIRVDCKPSLVILTTPENHARIVNELREKILTRIRGREIPQELLTITDVEMALADELEGFHLQHTLPKPIRFEYNPLFPERLKVVFKNEKKELTEGYVELDLNLAHMWEILMSVRIAPSPHPLPILRAGVAAHREEIFSPSVDISGGAGFPI